MSKKKTFLAKARSWESKHHLRGPHAFQRFVMLTFVHILNEVTDEFVFKGGNLLWLYIKTPRSTVDIDFVTKTLDGHKAVRESLEAACQKTNEDITFSIKSFKEIEQQGNLGAAVTIGYVTTQGQTNTIDLDIVYAVPSSVAKIMSPIEADEFICVATIENIISDKISTCHRFKGGNTRMKDFDDLWRISQSKPSQVRWELLKEVFETKGVLPQVNLEWINPEMARSWKSHVRRNQDLPTDLSQLMKDVNSWLSLGLSALE